MISKLRQHRQQQQQAQHRDGDSDSGNDDRSRTGSASHNNYIDDDDDDDATQVTSNQNNSKSGNAADSLQDSLDFDVEEAGPLTTSAEEKSRGSNIPADYKPDDGQRRLTEDVGNACEKRTSISAATPGKSSTSPSDDVDEIPSTTIRTPRTNRRAEQDSRKCNTRTTKMPPRANKRTHWYPTNKKTTKGNRLTKDVDHTVLIRSRNNDGDDGADGADGADDLQSKPGEINFVPDGSLGEEDDLASHGSHPTRHTHTSHSSSSSSAALFTIERIRAFMTDYYEDFDSIFQNGSSVEAKKACFEAFFDQYYTKEIIWVRSSGNPIGRQDLAGMLCDDIEIIRAILVSIDNIQLLAGGLAAVVVYTADLKFLYKGEPQSDRTVLSSMLETKGSEILIAHVHWSAGKPIPKESRWESKK